MINITDTAVKHINEIASSYINDSSTQSLILAIVIKKMGCSGFGYDFKLIKYDFKFINSVDAANKYHILEPVDGCSFSIALPKGHIDSLKGSTIDYRKVDSFTTKLVLDIPIAKDHCGCGESFSLS